MSQTLELLDYRRTVAELYREVRENDPGEETWSRWRRRRDELFASHPQSPIEDRETFDGLPFFDFDPSWRAEAEFVPGDDESTAIAHSGDGSTTFRKVGKVVFDVDGRTHSLSALWLDAYGGGLFIPFRDGTNGTETYGGGRYLLDTVKGADLGHDGDRIVLDFNYSYHPSCVHSVQWSCPLSPPENRLDVRVTAGEQLRSVSEMRASR